VRTSAPAVLFVVLCLFWGSNWLVLKLAIAEAPPFALAASRSVLAGALMVAIAGPREAVAMFRAAPMRMLAAGILTNTLTYAGLYWGTARIPSGLAAIVNSALMPVALAVFGLVFREETFSWRRAAGIALGAAGLVLLFGARSGQPESAAIGAGIAAVVAGTLAYALGSVWSGPLVRRGSPMAIGGVQMLVGGMALAPVALLVEGSGALAAIGRPLPLAATVWLALAGGVLGTTIYLKLIRDWGPTPAGMYAFVTPVVAAALGAAVLGERLGAREALGGAVLLGAAALVLPPRRASH
jgi:drug/metabolite transporter (DMT)-like permease